MAKDMGTAGGKDAVHYFQPLAEGEPTTGFDSAPKGEFNKFEPLHGFGGSNRGAH